MSRIPVPQRFPTVCAYGLLEELGDIAAPPLLVVTMRDLWEDHGLRERTGLCAGGKHEHVPILVHFVDSLEAHDLDAAYSALMRQQASSSSSTASDVAAGDGGDTTGTTAAAAPRVAAFVRPPTVAGIGGGQALDVAK